MAEGTVHWNVFQVVAWICSKSARNFNELMARESAGELQGDKLAEDFLGLVALERLMQATTARTSRGFNCSIPEALAELEARLKNMEIEAFGRKLKNTERMVVPGHLWHELRIVDGPLRAIGWRNNRPTGVETDEWHDLIFDSRQVRAMWPKLAPTAESEAAKQQLPKKSGASFSHFKHWFENDFLPRNLDRRPTDAEIQGAAQAAGIPKVSRDFIRRVRALPQTPGTWHMRGPRRR